MTQKALNFIVNGMLATEKDVATRRIAHILANVKDESVIDGFTDGFVETVTIEDKQKLFSYVCDCNKSKVFQSLKGITIGQDGFNVHINVECERVVYGKPNGKSWETSDRKEGEYTERIVQSYTQCVRIYPGCKVPGVSYTIL